MVDVGNVFVVQVDPSQHSQQLTEIDVDLGGSDGVPHQQFLHVLAADVGIGQHPFLLYFGSKLFHSYHQMVSEDGLLCVL